MSTLEDAVQAIRMGDKEEGRQILEEILEADESNEEVWLWLSSVVDTDEDREICLENVLALNPDNAVADKGLEALRSGTFNINTMMGDALDEMEEEEVAESTTFLDEFEMADDDFDDDGDDDDLVMPSTMGGPSAKKKKAGLGGLNIKMIVLAGIVLLVLVLAVGGVVATLFTGGDDGQDAGPDSQPSQEVPAGGGEQQPAATEIATETPTPTHTPTDTPTATATITPFMLPTPIPTEQPSPTATPVVNPTMVQ